MFYETIVRAVVLLKFERIEPLAKWLRGGLGRLLRKGRRLQQPGRITFQTASKIGETLASRRFADSEAASAGKTVNAARMLGGCRWRF